MRKKFNVRYVSPRLSYVRYLLVIIVAAVLFTACNPGWDIQNPYAEVDWKNHRQYKANLHTHTTRSDGRMNPQTVVDKYHMLGYKILAITDHNQVTYPWTQFAEMEASTTSRERLAAGGLNPEDLVYQNRDPEKLGMIAIQANELSSHHHIGSFFNDHNGTTTEEESLKATAAKNGLTVIYHPGRYTERNPEKYTLDWYVDVFSRYDHLIGVEVYNQGDRYPYDRMLWDSILTRLILERPVWGISNDDMHGEGALGRNWNVFMLPELSSDWVRTGMKEGRFYYVYAPGGHKGPKPPGIESVKINQRKGIIEIAASGQDSIKWITAGGIEIHNGNVIDLKNQPLAAYYLRAELYGPGETITGTQPFKIRKR